MFSLIYITGDTHRDLNSNKLYSKNLPHYTNCTKDDYLIVAGDFGYVWDNSEKELNLRDVLNSKKFTTLFVDGNHENFDLLATFPIITKFGGKVRQIDTSIFQLMRGEVYLIAGKTIFTFGGASSVDKERRRVNVDWWGAELPTYEEIENAFINLEKIDYKVDIVVTHTAPSSLVDTTLGFKSKYDLDICNHLFEELRTKLIYGKWYYGHFHTDKVIGKDIAIYNNVLTEE